MFSLHQKYLFEIKNKGSGVLCTYFYLKNTFKRIGRSQVEIQMNWRDSILGDGDRLAKALFIAEERKYPLKTIQVERL